MPIKGRMVKQVVYSMLWIIIHLRKGRKVYNMDEPKNRTLSKRRQTPMAAYRAIPLMCNVQNSKPIGDRKQG